MGEGESKDFLKMKSMKKRRDPAARMAERKK
jgi:hypothetical protein